MNLPYQFFIAFRYFKSKKRRRGISVNTLISIAGVALGVMVLISVLAIMGGFHDDLQKKILGVNAHIVVLNYSGKIKAHESVRNEINGIKGVKHSAPVIYGQVMLGFNDRAHGVVVRGVEPDIEAGVTNIIEYLKEGDISGLKKDDENVPGIILGRELARTLGLFLGDKVKMISPESDIGPLGMLPRMKKFRVAGIFEAGMYEYDLNLALVHIKEAQNFFRLGDQITGVEVKVDDIYDSEAVAERIETRLGPPYYARDWMNMNKNLFSALMLEKWAIFITLTLIVLVASFNIVSNLIMIIIEKAREIAVMKAMGATSRSIMSIFMIHGLIIGIIGTVIGLISGLVFCQILKVYEFPLPPDIYYLSHLPVRVSLLDLIIVPAAAIIISFLATLYPSWQAAKLDPIEPLRYE